LGGTQQQDEELDHIKSEHDDKIKRFKAEASVFYKGLEDLKQATTVQVTTRPSLFYITALYQ